jgi:hypothetical protein
MSEEKKSEKTVEEKPKPKKRRLVLWIVIAGVLALVILVALLPALLSTGPARRMVLSNVNEKLNGTLDIADWSLGWFSGFRMDAVSLKDSEGQTAAEVKSVSLPATVPALMGGSKTLGTVHANAPRLNVVLLPDGRTNFHVIFAQLIGPPTEGPVKVPFDISGKIVVSDGEISVKPQGAPTAMRVKDLNAEVNIESLSKPIAMTSTATLGANGASMQMRGSVTPVHDGILAPEALEGSVNVQLTGLELAEFSPLAKTFGAPVDVAGTMNMTLDAQLQGASSVTARGAVKASGLEFSGGPLGVDRPRLAEASLDFDVASASKRITVNALRLESPVARASAEGWVGASPVGALPAGNLKTHVESDLAGVAALMPRTLNLQEGLTVTGGTLTLDGTLSSDGADGLPRFESSMRIEGLAAQQNGREVTLDAPIRIELAAVQTPTGPRLDRFLMDSPFAHAEGSGTLEKFSMEMTSDLDALTAEAGKFVALNGRSLSGAAKLTLRTTVAEGARRDVNGLLKITSLSVTGFTPCPVLLGEVSSEFKAVAVLGKVSQPSALEKVSLTFASPVLGASFTADRVSPSFDGGLPVAFENGIVTGNADLADVSRIVNSCEALGVTLDAAGQVSLKAPLKVEKGAIIMDPDLQASDLRYTQQGKTFTERMLRVTGHLEAQPDSRTVEAREFAAQTSFGELRVPRALVSDWADPFGKPLSANIEGAVQLEQLRVAVGDFVALPKDTVLKGRADFQLRLTAASTATANVRATMADLDIERPGLPPLKEKEVVMLAVADLDFPEKRADIRSFSLTSSLLTLTASGSLSDWTNRMLLDAAGTLTPDWERIAPLVATVIGQPVELKGRRERPFSLRVPLGEKDPKALLRDSRADLGMGMESASLMGVQVQPLDVAVKAGSGLASVDVTGGLLGGALDLPLRMDATGEEARLRIPDDSPLLQSVTINDALADGVLARFSPVFARAINTSGVVGLTSRRLSSPLDPLLLTEATVDMELALNGVAFRSAGFLGELLSLAGMGETTLMQLPDQTVTVGLEGGRIRQGPMAIQFGGYTMTLSGLMGLDGTLDMTAELPVTPGMVRDKSIYELIKGEKLRVPIKGTVAKPAIGKNILTDNLDKLVRSAGKKLLEKEGGKLIEKGLKEIFK